MLTHPTLDKLQALRLTGMARAPKSRSTVRCFASTATESAS
jgi:hypothetical protein